MITKNAMLLAVLMSCISPAVSKEWSRGWGCGFANLGGCRADIKPGEHFTTPKAYAFRNPSEQSAWKSMRNEYMTGRRKDFIPIDKADGVVAVGSDVVMTAIDNLLTCCPGGDFEGVVEHPQIGEVYIIEVGRF